jgi:hypothetical protein
VAHIIRSRADLINLEAKLHQLVVNELGFNQTTRLFENALKPNLNSNDKINDEADQINSNSNLNYVSLKDFILKLGKVYDIFNINNQG